VWARATVLAITCVCVLTFPARAQINIDELTPAGAYDAGVVQPGLHTLGGNLWQNTTALQATKLINAADTNAADTKVKGTARLLIQMALLSSGVPPRPVDSSEREIYNKARLSALLKLRDLTAFDQIFSRADIRKNNPVFNKIIVERALLGGDTNTACTLNDTLLIDRKAPYWAKLRAFCHFVRGEIPAAELTADLLARAGYDDKIFFALLDKLTGRRFDIKISNITTPLRIAMLSEILKSNKLDKKSFPDILLAKIALDMKTSPDDRLFALLGSAHILSLEQIRTVLGGLANAPVKNRKAPINHDSQAVWNAQKWGEVYQMLDSNHDLNGVANAAGALLTQAQQKGILLPIARALETKISAIPAEYKAKNNVYIFARIAVHNRDTDTLGALFLALKEDNPLRGRIALASDALGGGFLHGELGIDIETRLADKATRARAVRDSYIAAALGANLSDMATQVLARAKLEGQAANLGDSGNSGDLLALHAAARRGAKAELALLAAKIFTEIPPGKMRADNFAAILSAMMSAGMTGTAGHLAALDMLGHD